MKSARDAYREQTKAIAEGVELHETPANAPHGAAPHVPKKKSTPSSAAPAAPAPKKAAKKK